MEVLFFCPLWGSNEIAFDDFVEKVKSAGYDGVEMGLPLAADQKNRILSTIEKADLLLIGQHWQTLDADFQAHKVNYEKQLHNVTESDVLFVNSQTGKDYFSFEQNCELIEIAARISENTGVQIAHETHRGKFSFAVHVTQKYLEHFPDLRLSLDISHWCNVSESLLEDQQDAVAMALSRTEHIHSRVGFSQGPQIPDPRVDEWKDTLQRHIAWWDQVIERVRSENREFFTITSEFGPVPYMQVHPQTKQPLANQWDINVYMKDLLSARYNS